VETQIKSFNQAYARLATARKDDASGGAPYSRFINRPLGRVFAAFSFQLGLTPNQVTLISGCTTFAGIIVLAWADATLVTGAVVAVLLILGYAMDSADGQLARLRGGGSLSGEWLDHMFDTAKLASINLAVAITWHQHYDLPSALYLLIPLAFSVVQVVAFGGMLLTELMLRVHQAAAHPGQKFVPPVRAGSRHPMLFTVLRLPVDYGVSCVAFLFIGSQIVFVAVYSVMALASLGFLVLALPRYFGQLRRATLT
jgi:phosphatidylglycerophosphate synthase